MYKLLLTFRYLRRKLIPIFAMLAVVLCTAMVIIVLSVMGGFLDLVRDAGRTMMGDVAMYAGLGGFPRYEELIEEIEELPEAEAAAPTMMAYGLLAMPGDVVEGVQVLGVDGHEQARVTEYQNTLFWTPERLAEHPTVANRFGDYSPEQAAMDLEIPWTGASEDDVALVMGIEVSPYAVRLNDGTYRFSPSLMGEPMTLNVLPVTGAGGVSEPTSTRVVPVNKFHSGVFDVDSSRVYIPFERLQEMMKMDEAQRVDTSVTPPRPTGEVIPARTTEVHIRAAEGVSAAELREAVFSLYESFAGRYDDMPAPFSMQIQTWEQRQAQFLRAVENEKGLMTFLFGIISITAVAMIGVIFYMIVLEKTRDIGILRALGASRRGVASIFLSFGAVIGTIGAAVGTTLAYLVVTNINELHTWLGSTFGIQIWDRSVYFFERIPDRVDWNEVGVIVIVAIIASIAGAAVPAVKAARVDPVASLRYE